MIIEKTKTATLTNTGTGNEAFGIDLGDNAHHYIAGLHVFVNGSDAQITYGFSQTETGAFQNIFGKNKKTSTKTPVGGSQIILGTTPVISNYRYLRLDINHNAADTVEVIVSYSSIPNANPATNLMNYAVGELAEGESADAIIGPAGNSFYAVKSIYLVERNDVNITAKAYFTSSGVQSQFYQNSTIQNRTSDGYRVLLQLREPTDIITIENATVDPSTLYYYISYVEIQDPEG